MATEEMIRKGQGILAKINFAKQRVKDFMNGEDRVKDILKKEYYSGKVKEWTLKLDALRNELKQLGEPAPESPSPGWVSEAIEYYEEKVNAIDRKYLFTQDKEKGRIDYRKIAKLDVVLKEAYEDFLADLKKQLPQPPKH